MHNHKTVLTIKCLFFALVVAGCGSTSLSNSERFYGSGTVSDPYLIFNKTDFMKIGGGFDTKNIYYRLEADLVGKNTITKPLGDKDSPFLGIFEGNGHTVNLEIIGNHYLSGLFAQIGEGNNTPWYYLQPGIVKNLKLTGIVDVEGDNVYRAGALAGLVRNYGSEISGIASTVSVTVKGPNVQAAGGVTSALLSAKIEHSYSTGNVFIHNTQNTRVVVGGITVGGQDGIIRNCWASGNIESKRTNTAVFHGKNFTGGIVGYPVKEVIYSVALNEIIAGDSVSTCEEVGTPHFEPVDFGTDGILYHCGNYGTFRIGTGFEILHRPIELKSNYANKAMVVDNGLGWGSDVEMYDSLNVGANERHGAGVSIEETEADDGVWWKTTAGWAGYFGESESAPWKWDAISKRPVLWFE